MNSVVSPEKSAKMTRLDILEDIVDFYGKDVKRRCLDLADECKYNFDGKRCAVGRYMSEEVARKADFDNGNYNALIENELLPADFPFREDRAFWAEIQDLHDSERHWGNFGLNSNGVILVTRLKSRYEGAGRTAELELNDPEQVTGEDQ